MAHLSEVLSSLCFSVPQVKRQAPQALGMGWVRGGADGGPAVVHTVWGSSVRVALGQRASWRTVGDGDEVESIKLSALPWYSGVGAFVLMLGRVVCA